MPWIIVCAVLLVWGSDWFKVPMNKIFICNYPVEGLHNMISKVPPVVAKPTTEGAVFAFTWLSYTGSGMLIAAILSAFVMGFSPGAPGQGLRRDDLGAALLADHHRRHAGDRHAHPLLRHRRHARPGLRPRGLPLSVLRHPARLAGRGADRIGHRVERAVRRPAEDHRRAAGPVAHPDGARRTPRAASWAR